MDDSTLNTISIKQLHVSINWKSFGNYVQQRLRGVRTGIANLDRTLLGLSPLTVVMGKPKSHKSTFLLQVLHYNAFQGNPALLIDLENGRERWRMRLLCQANQVCETTIKLLEGDNEALSTLQKKLNPLPLYQSTTAVQPGDIRNLVSSLIQLTDKPVLLGIDSLQGLPIFPGSERDEESLKNWMKFFDSLKLEYEGRLTIIVVSEKNRSSYDGAVLGGGAGSRSIEYKGELVLDMSPNKDQSIDMQVLANRDGVNGIGFTLFKKLEVDTDPCSFTFTLTDQGKTTKEIF